MTACSWLVSSSGDVSVNSSCAHLPRSECGAFARIVSPGGRALAYSRATPRAFDTHVVSDSNPKVKNFIGKHQKFVTDWLVRQGLDKIVDVFQGIFHRFYALPHCLSSYILSYHCLYTKGWSRTDQRDCVFRVQNVFDDILEVGHLPSFFIPTPRNLPPKTKKMLIPGG